jgi:hypothetical protein
MGWLDFVNGPAGTYYCRGMKDDPTRILYLADKILLPWSLSAFGSWRMNVLTITGTTAQYSNSWSMTGGIVSVNGIVIQGAGAVRNYSFYDTHFIVSNQIIISSTLGNAVNTYFKGCIVRCDSIDVDLSTPSTVLNGLNLRDSILIVDSNINRGNEFRNSVLNRPMSAWSSVSSIVSCQFNWIPPTWPLWNAVKDSWKYSILSQGTSSPIVISATGSFSGYEYDLFGNLRSTAAGIGAFFFDVSNYRLYLVQGINRHIIKRLDSNVAPAVFDGEFYGIYGEAGRLNFPSSVTTDGSNIFLCDYKNSRVIRFDKTLNFIYEYNTSLTMNDQPFLIYYDSITTDLYVLRVTESLWNMKLERLGFDNNGFTSKKISGFLGKMTDGLMPTAMCRGFASGEFLVCGLGNDIYKTVESPITFSSFVNQSITGQEPNRYMGMIKHSNGYLYLNSGLQLVKANSSFESLGVSNLIATVTTCLKESLNAKILLYSNHDQSILRYDTNLNFVEEVFKDNGTGIATDSFDVVDLMEIDLVA